MARTLDQLVADAEERFPGLIRADGTSRAFDAAQLVRDGAVRRTYGVGGADAWRVGRYDVSVRAKSCTCADSSAPIHNGGKLCKHRLAAMFAVRRGTTPTDVIANILAGAKGDRVTLRADVYFHDSGRSYWLSGHHYPGEPWQRYAPGDRVQFSERDFQRALEGAGWALSQRPVKQGMSMHYLIERASADQGTGYNIGASDQARVERENQSARFEFIQNLTPDVQAQLLQSRR